MTRKEAAEKLKSLWYFLINNDYPQKDLDALKVAIKALEQEPCGDCISREDVKKHKVYSTERHEYVVPVAYIDWQPSVSTQQKVGRWVKEGQGGRYKWMCSNCGTHHRALYDYCPSCGTRMEVEK